VQQYPDFEKIAAHRADIALPIPADLPTTTTPSPQYRFAETSIYPFLETNVSANAMAFSQEPFGEERTALNISRHGPNSPFRHWTLVEKYVQELLNRRGYHEFVEYNTTVELVSKDTASGKWVVTLRRPLLDESKDKWWTEIFDAVVVASGHYTVPFIPATPGLADLERNFPGTVEHSKAWRGVEKYRNKRTVVVGASISGADISWTLADFAETPLIAVTRGKYHPVRLDSSDAYGFNIVAVFWRLGISAS
jgi:cation diffusion facilitator CzcD-associated flavoprotein CzcO